MFKKQIKKLFKRDAERKIMFRGSKVNFVSLLSTMQNSDNQEFITDALEAFKTQTDPITWERIQQSMDITREIKILESRKQHEDD